MLNLLLKTIQKELCRKHARVGNDTERTYVYNSQHERLWGMLLTINQDDIMEKQKNLPLTARLSTCRERME